MSNYPKIFSLSTVGIRQHNNYDYLFHEVRTDFTGRNGTGKSIIADLMQLIFIPYSDLWKSGTEGLNKQDRRVWGMPLPKKYINFAYAFLNIEKSKGKFVTIGVYIPRNRQPVRPFIVSRVNESENKSKDKTLIPFDFSLKAEDFLTDSKAVLSINEIKQNLLLSDLKLQDFYQKDNITQYFDIIYKAELCPIDLTRESNLKAYAKVLQSFSRAKSLNINNSKSLQNFLFEDDEEIKQVFVEQKEQLENYIKQYRRDSESIDDLEKKQQRLIELKSVNENYTKKKDEYFSSDVINSFNKYGEEKKAYYTNQKALERAKKSIGIHKSKLQESLIGLCAQYIYLKKSSQHLWNKYKEEKPNYSETILKKKQEEVENLGFTIKTIESIKKVYERYDSSAEKIVSKFEEQEVIKENKRRIDKLKAISSFSDFEVSEWSKDFIKAKSKYQNRLHSINKEIDNLYELLKLYDNKNPNSLFQWAIHQNTPFTLAQETVLMYLRNIATDRKKVSEVTRYTEEPLKLLNSFSEAENGIWLHLGHLTEFIAYASNPKFADVNNTKIVLENDKTELNKKVLELESERDSIQSLDKDLSNIGYNIEYCEIWKCRKQVENYLFDDEVSAANIENMNKVLDSINSYDKLKGKHVNLQKQITDIARKDEKLDAKINQYSKELDEYNDKIGECKKDISNPFKEIPFPENLYIDAYEKKHIQMRDELKNLEKSLDAIKLSISTQGSNIKSCIEKEPLLKKNFDQSENEFNKKKGALESKTNLSFDSLMHVGDLSDDKIEQIKSEYEDQKEKYHQEFTKVVETFEETKGGKNAELIVNEYNFDTLVRVLCGKFKLENLAPELSRLNDELANFGKLQLEIIFNVFSKVEKNYRKLKTLVVHLNNFFKQNKISNDYIFRVDFKDRTEISIDWIDKMRNSAKTQAYGKDLFSDLENSDELSPEQLIINIAKKFSKIKNCELADLLNPKYYFELNVGMYDDENNSNSGSGGQAYTALALLCIGRMSVIQKERKPGVKFIIIEELSNIDDTNFNTFPEIARQFGYQLLTMTPKPFGSYTKDDWFLHMLSKGTDKEINYTPMSFFKTKNSKEYLSDYMKRNELENITNTQ